MILKKILNLLEEKDLSLSQLEKQCGLGNGTIRGWDKSDPSISNVKKVADYFGVDINYFLEDD